MKKIILFLTACFLLVLSSCKSNPQKDASLSPSEPVSETQSEELSFEPSEEQSEEISEIASEEQSLEQSEDASETASEKPSFEPSEEASEEISEEASEEPISYVENLFEAFSSVSDGDTLVFKKDFKYTVNGASAFSFSNRTDGVNTAAIYLNEKNNITVDGNGATLFIEGLLTPFVVENCENIEIKNLKIEYESLPIVSFSVVDYDNGVCTVETDDGVYYDLDGKTIVWHSAPDAQGNYSWSFSHRQDGVVSGTKDETTGALKPFTIPAAKRDLTEEGTNTFSMSVAKTSGFEEGKYFTTCSLLPEQFLVATGCDGFTFQNVSSTGVHGSILITDSSNLTFDGVEVALDDGFSSDAPLFIFNGLNGKAKIVNGTFSGSANALLSAENCSNEILIKDNSFSLYTGDVLCFKDCETIEIDGNDFTKASSHILSVDNPVSSTPTATVSFINNTLSDCSSATDGVAFSFNQSQEENKSFAFSQSEVYITGNTFHARFLTEYSGDFNFIEAMTFSSNDGLPFSANTVLVKKIYSSTTEKRRYRLLTFGDSITYGTNGTGGVVQKTYTRHLSELLNATEAEQYGIPGSMMSSYGSDFGLESGTNRYDALVDGDVIVVALGTNDWGLGGIIPLGSPQDTTDVSFYGATDIVLKGIKENNPNARVFVLSPIPRADSAYNPTGTLQDFASALSVVANRYGFDFIDGAKMPLDATDTSVMPDHLHPNDSGHVVYANYLFENILSAMLTPKKVALQ